MAQNYRNQSGRSDYGRGGRYQTDSERDRYRTGGEQRFNPDWDERNDRGFEGDRSYSAGGYSEEFGYRRGHNRDENDRDFRGANYESRGSGANYQNGRSEFGREGQSRYDEGRFDEGNRWSEGSSGQDFGSSDFYERGRRTGTSSWHEDEGDRGGYFGTGNYIDDGGASRSPGADFYRARERQMRHGSGSRGGTSGDYGNSYYGSQSGYGRDYGNVQREQQRPWRGQHQQGGSQSGGQWGGGSSSCGAQQGGSSSFGGAWGRSESYGSQSHRGRGPQGYQRSDERLKEMICERLTDDPAIDASNITVEVTSQIVKLTGTVDDRGTKYEIEELIESFGGVKDIDNQLRVQSAAGQSGQTGQTGQQLRGGSDWEPGSSSIGSSGSTAGRTGSTSSTMTTSGTSPSPSKRN